MRGVNTPTEHDEPYVLGRLPTAAAPFPFTTVQYARLLVLRGRVQDGLVNEDVVVDRPRPRLSFMWGCPVF
jgi:hypothetical protein